jgi:ATP-dependent protease Clp ATPase subunit
MIGGGGGGGTRMIQAETTPVSVTKVPKVQDKAIQETAAEAIRRRKNARGYRSTILSSTLVDPELTRKTETLGS